jgi:tetratricopeptide (TPR) repeat protein
MKKIAVLLFVFLATLPLMAQVQDAEFYSDRAWNYFINRNPELAILDYNQAIAIKPTDASIWYSRGLIYYEKLDYVSAIRDFTVAAALNPDDCNAWYQLGLAHYWSNEPTKAVTALNNAIDREPSFSYAWSFRGLAYHALGEKDTARKDFDRALAWNPDLISDLIDDGLRYYYVGNYDITIEWLNLALIIDPKRDDAWYRRGEVYQRLGKTDLAIEDFTQAITSNPENIYAYNDRGIAYYDKHLWDLAIKDYSKAIALDNDFAWAWNNRGLAYKNRPERDLDWAIEDFSKAIELDDTLIMAYENRGSLYYGLGETEKAFDDFNMAVSLDPNDNEARFYRGLTSYDIGNTYRANKDFRGFVYMAFMAIEDFTDAIANDPNDDRFWYWRGYVYMKIADEEQAIDDFNMALDLNPNNAEAWYYRGSIYYDTDEYDKALPDLNEAKRLGVNDAVEKLGYIHYYIGELDLAIQDFNAFVAYDPDNSSALGYLGYVLCMKGEYEQAIEILNKAIEMGAVEALYNRGLVYKDMGEFELALRDFDAYFDAYFDEDTDNIIAWGSAWAEKGKVFLASGDYNKTIETYNAFFNELFKELKYNEIIIKIMAASVLPMRGEAYYQKGELELAIKDFSKAIDVLPDSDYAWFGRGLAYSKTGETEKALEDYRKSIEIAEKSVNIRDIYFRSWEFAGSFYKASPFLNNKVFDDAHDKQFAELTREVLGISIDRAEKARSAGARGVGTMTSLLYQYYAGVDFEASFGSPDVAFAYSERLRSRGFLEQMAIEDALKQLPGINPEDAKRVRALSREVSNLQNILSASNLQMEPSKYNETANSLTRAEAELALLNAKISERVPGYAELSNPKTVDIDMAKSFCGDDTAVLEYVLWDSTVAFEAPFSSDYGRSKYRERPSINSYCLVLTKDGVTPVALNPDFDYTFTVEELREYLTHFIMDKPPKEEIFEEERNALYNALIKPVLGHIPDGIKKLLIVPDGNLAFLPFDVLRENSKSASLGEKYSITFSPSVSCSVVARQKNIPLAEPIIAFGGVWYDKDESKNRPPAEISSGNRIAALNSSLVAYRGVNTVDDVPEKTRAVDYYSQKGWPYLAGTVEEILGLEKITTVKPTIYQGREVTKRFIKRLSLEGTFLNYPIIHFACHGYFNDNLIPQAALVFSEVSGLLGSESREDGYLSIDEIALLQLNAKMVMLSACQTGLGQIKRGDGMSGLARAFMTAGAQNVGVSLWSISDEATVEFMWGVYRKVIREGKSFHDAYSEVKEEFRKDPKWSHPYFWAAFTMYE